MTEHLRWIATLIYSTDAGPVEVEHHIEELEVLDLIVEQGPDWNALDKIEIRLNSLRRSYHVTVEEALKL